MDIFILALVALCVLGAVASSIIGMTRYYDRYGTPEQVTTCCGTGCISFALAFLIPCVYTNAEWFAYVIPLFFLAAGLIALVVARREYLVTKQNDTTPQS